MSKSRRKSPIRGVTTAESEKKDKQMASRKLRRLVKKKMTKKEEVLPIIREVSNIWDFQKDGKRYIAGAPEEIMRK